MGCLAAVAERRPQTFEFKRYSFWGDTVAETFHCPIHGEVEGVIPMDGPLSNAVPVPLLCELCPGETVVGYDEDESEGHRG